MGRRPQIDLRITHIADCVECGSEFLVTDQPRPSVLDAVECPRCNTMFAVGKIFGPSRSSGDAQKLRTELRYL